MTQKGARPRTSLTDQAPVENALTRIRIGRPKMAKGAGRIADFVLEHPERVVRMSETE